MTIRAHVHYNTPTDPEHFESYFVSTHVPIVNTIPGLQSFEYGKVLGNADGTPSTLFWIATLNFADMEAMGASMGSPEGAAAAADMANYASGGATMVLSEVL